METKFALLSAVSLNASAITEIMKTFKREFDAKR